MWRTSQGERILQGAEAELFRSILGCAYDRIDDPLADDDFIETGVSAFDRLQREQKLALLAEVGRALLDESAGMPELTAVREGVVGALYELVRQEIDCELDMEDDFESLEDKTYWRSRVRNAYLEATADYPDEDEYEPSEPRSHDRDEWYMLVDMAADQILWDNDWELEKQIADEPPERAEFLKAQLGIDPGYFTDVAPDADIEQLKAIRATLDLLTGASHLGRWYDGEPKF